MTFDKKQVILHSAKIFFRERIAQKHINNTQKLKSLDEFNVNPFLLKYLANFAFGDSSAESMAKALVYPRVLGTSIATTFGNQLQFFCNEVLSSFASTTPGIDIEFVDAVDGRKKYCQVKAGPSTINYDDVTTIENHFNAIKNLARTNRVLDFNPMYDCIVGVFYGTHEELNANYKRLENNYQVLSGQDFWYHLTGDENFYSELIDAFAEVAEEVNCAQVLDVVINKVAQEIKQKR